MSATAAAATKKLLVLGGSGYVGQNICHAAAASGQFVVQSFSRSGPPKKELTSAHLELDQVEWIQGDIFDEGRRKEVFAGVDYILSTIGAFGSNEFMEKICGDSTIQAVETAKDAGVQRFGFISSAQVGKLDIESGGMVPLRGYYKGKTRAEEALREVYPESHLILRPGFVYGRRPTPIGTLPLALVGEPAHFFCTKLGPLSSAIQALPFVGTEAASMVPVEAVRQASVDTMMLDDDKFKLAKKLLQPEDIRRFG